MSAREVQLGKQRRSMIGSGDRSAKIRTYNYPQSRITDHRIHYTQHNLAAVANGALGPLIQALRIADYQTK